jgi:hypothetical protein
MNLLSCLCTANRMRAAARVDPLLLAPPPAPVPLAGGSVVACVVGGLPSAHVPLLGAGAAQPPQDNNVLAGLLGGYGDHDG